MDARIPTGAEGAANPETGGAGSGYSGQERFSAAIAGKPLRNPPYRFFGANGKINRC